MSEIMSIVCSTLFTGAVSGTTIYLKGQLKKSASKASEKEDDLND